ncbi:hypothetical protein F5Y11DRAFT_124741 [Daldinia sp. FL1419]|nr:hypothetical protein F5Y11DRAFT_124741 [Daldinia sp. FL1419]
MKLAAGPLFTTLALIAYLPSILAGQGLAANKGSIAVRSAGLAYNGTASGNDAGQVNQGDDNNDDAGKNADDDNDQESDENEEGNADDQENADDENQNQDDNANDDQNNDQNADENLDENKDDNNDKNNIKDNLQQNIGNLMLSLGVCDFDLGSLSGIGVGNQIQLLLQLQQLAQLQQLGLVNSFSIEQLVRQEILRNNFNLKIIKRTVSASVKQATRENKRSIVARKECRNK